MTNEFWIDRWLKLGLGRLSDRESCFSCDTLTMNLQWNGRLSLQPHKEMDNPEGRFCVHSAKAGLAVNEIMNFGI